MYPISEKPAGNGLRLAKIVRAHPSGQAHDVVFLDDFSRAAGVQSIATHASNNAGTVHMHRPDSDPDQPWDARLHSLESQTLRDVIAVVAMMGVTPVIIGHLPPQISQLNFPDDDAYKNLHIDRHASDVVASIDDQANYALVHPGNAFIAINQSGDAPDFTGKDYDKVWQIARNTESPPIITIRTNGKDSKGNHKTAKVVLYPGGDVTIYGDGSVSITAAEYSITMHAGEDIGMTASEDISANAGENISASAGAHIGLTAPRIDLH